jgi:hypothetical protein
MEVLYQLSYPGVMALVSQIYVSDAVAVGAQWGARWEGNAKPASHLQ